MAKKQKTLHDFLIQKIRSASQKWPETYKIKDRVRVEVRVEYDKSMPDQITIHVPQTTCRLANGEEYIVLNQIIIRKCHKPAQNRNRVMYLCENCKRLFFERDWVSVKGVMKDKIMLAADHIEPVVAVTGWVDWNTFFARMFPGDSGLQILCNYPGEIGGAISCHSKKTKEENSQRKEYRKKTK